MKSINAKCKTNVLHTRSTNHEWLACCMQASIKVRRKNEESKLESKKQIIHFLYRKWICALTKTDKGDASVNQNAVMLTVSGMPRNKTIQTFESKSFSGALSEFFLKFYDYFSRLIKENSDTMLVISKTNMDAIWVNASVHLLTEQSLVSSNFYYWPTVNREDDFSHDGICMWFWDGS